VAATLHLVREKGIVIELRRSKFHVLLDNTDVGTIDMHDTIEAPIKPGRHTLQIKAGRYTSGRHPFDAWRSRRSWRRWPRPGTGWATPPATPRPASRARSDH
jgi:hypothetical protein